MKLSGGANFSSPSCHGDPVLSVQLILWRNCVFLSARPPLFSSLKIPAAFISSHPQLLQLLIGLGDSGLDVIYA